MVKLDNKPRGVVELAGEIAKANGGGLSFYTNRVINWLKINEYIIDFNNLTDKGRKAGITLKHSVFQGCHYNAPVLPFCVQENIIKDLEA